MKILWLSQFVPYPPAGGSPQRSYHTLRHTAERHEVHLLALHQPRLLPTQEALDASVAVLSRMCASVRAFPIPAERSRVHRALCIASSVLGTRPYDVVWMQSDALRRAVDDAQRALEPDLVHVETIGLWPYVASWRQPPVVLSHHNVESEFMARRAEHESSALRAAILRRDADKLRVLERRAASDASVNLVVSPLDGERLLAIAPGATVEVVDNGVDTEYWDPGDDRTANGIVFAGTLGWYPNRDAVEFLLAEIWPALLASNPDRRLTIVGRDPPPIALAAAADPRVRVPGFVPDVRPYLRESAIAVCPMLVGGGTRLKILDALAMRKPVVSTAIGVEGLELVADEHYLRAETATEFVGQIRRLEADEGLRRRLGEAGRRRVIERYDWHVVGQSLDRAFARAMGASRRPSTLEEP